MSERVRIVVGVPMSDYLVEQIAAVDPRVEVVYDASHFAGPRYLGDHHGNPREPRSDAERDRFFNYLSDADVVYGIPELDPKGLHRLATENERVRWVHAAQAGAGAIVRAANLPAEHLQRITVTTSAGVHAEPLAEFSIFGMLAGSQNLQRLLRDQAAHAWNDRVAISQLSGATCLIVGAGEIGKAIAVRAKAMGMTTVGIKRRVEPLEHFDRMAEVSALAAEAAQADYIVVTLPGTPHTEKLVDATVFDACRDGVVFVNVGRGTVVDEQAMIAALQSGKIGYAALDVFEREPLDGASPLWDLPNVLVSPHSAALDDGEERRVAALFCENLRSFLAHQPMRNVVDVEQGY